MPPPLFLTARSPALSFVYLAVFVIATALRTYNDTSIATILGMSARKIAPRLVSPFLRSHALVALGVCASGMVFQMVLGYPVEIASIASIAPFATGIVLLRALAGFQRWSSHSRANA